MTIPVTPDTQGASTRPYLIRALHDWCTDNGFTPYLAVYVDASVQVPNEYVKNSEIVLNASFEATSSLQLGNEFVSFKARFGGTAREIVVPVDHIIAIYARENGQGMAFPAPPQAPPAGVEPVGEGSSGDAGAARSGLRLAASPAEESVSGEADAVDDLSPDSEPPPEPSGGGRPSLKRVK
ncbi:ClpXP protease specificity-enhancing factor [Methylibium sp.]|uniref:ClpXP protease specificity-enhancing factor n=1 Tax=Methylibium sp. TaxID=2067992 RepID=UPI003D0D0007